VSADASPRKSLGLVATTALVVGNMIGSGMFMLPATLAPFGAASILGWMLSGTGALALAWVFATLARDAARPGGPHGHARARFGDGAGFVVAWCYWVSTCCGNAAIAVAFAGSVASIVPALATPDRASLVAIAAMWLCTGFNLAGVRSAGIVQTLTTILKLLPLLVVLALGVAHVDTASLEPFNRSDQSLLGVATTTAALTLWALLGLESATVPAGHVRDPRRTIPRATLVGTALAAVVTMLACTLVLALLPGPELAQSTAPFADAARRLWGDAAGVALAGVAAIACFGTLNGWTLVMGEVGGAAARDGLFPRALGASDARSTPYAALLLGSAISTVLVASSFQPTVARLFQFSILVSTASCLVPYLVCAAAVLLARRAAGTPVATRAVAAIALVFSVWAMVGTGAQALRWAGGLIAAGLPLYAFVRWRQHARAG
jgi:APA family basic amino acid/polyamine antiporter